MLALAIFGTRPFGIANFVFVKPKETPKKFPHPELFLQNWERMRNILMK
jgi:hypothetical protein